MQELIDGIAEKMGISPQVAQKAVSVVLSLVKSEGDNGLVGQLFEKMPGADELAGAGTQALADKAKSGAGLMGMIGNALGGSTGKLMAAVSVLQSDGLDTSQIRQIGDEVMSYARQQGGDDLAGKVTESIPGLNALL